jgi:hypothetical protein
MIYPINFVKGITYLIFAILLLIILMNISDIDNTYTLKLSGKSVYRILLAILSISIIGSLLYCRYSQF